MYSFVHNRNHAACQAISKPAKHRRTQGDRLAGIARRNITRAGYRRSAAAASPNAEDMPGNQCLEMNGAGGRNRTNTPLGTGF